MGLKNILKLALDTIFKFLSHKALHSTNSSQIKNTDSAIHCQLLYRV